MMTITLTLTHDEFDWLFGCVRDEIRDTHEYKNDLIKRGEPKDIVGPEPTYIGEGWSKYLAFLEDLNHKMLKIEEDLLK